MRDKIVRLIALFGFVALLIAQSARAQGDDAQKHLEQLAIATSLDREGITPWHLKMSFELNDLSGKPKEKGTVEEWWTPKETRLVIQSPSYNVSFPGSGEKAPDRESYLVRQLLDQVMHPIPRYGNFYNLSVTEHEQKFGKATLSCLYVTRQSKGAKQNDPPMFCTEPGTNILRVASSSHEPYAIRNQMARFQNTSVALDDAIGYRGAIAIQGHVDVLEGYKPEADSAQISNMTVQAAPREGVAAVPGMVVAGNVISKAQPVYPQQAKIDHIGGTVVLGAVISETGTIATLYVVASPDKDLSASALDAVKQWTYKPYLLDGSPVEVETTITVNYNLNY